MLSNNVWCVIMAGGSGTLRTGLQSTLERFSALVPLERTLVVTTEQYASLIGNDFPLLPAANILSEPRNRGTAPCLALAMYVALKRDPDAILVATPVDIQTDDPDKFAQVMKKVSSDIVGRDGIIALGVPPKGPRTQLGYIQTEDFPRMDEPAKVKTFVEKPSLHYAGIFVDSGEFLWNSGIYVCRADALRQAFERYQMPITALFAGWQGALDTPSQPSFLENVYADMPLISIDRGLVERSSDLWVLPCDFAWSDKSK